MLLKGKLGESKILLWDLENSADPLLPSAANRDDLLGWQAELLKEKGVPALERAPVDGAHGSVAGLGRVRLSSAPGGTASSTEHSLSKEQWGFLWKCVHMEGESMKKRPFHVCVQHCTFLIIPECALTHSQPLQHCHAAQHTAGTACSAAMISAARPSWKPSHHYWLNLPTSYKLQKSLWSSFQHLSQEMWIW